MTATGRYLRNMPLLRVQDINNSMAFIATLKKNSIFLHLYALAMEDCFRIVFMRHSLVYV